MARCLFLAPLKPPDHPEPSGDRTIARLLVRLLEGMGYRVELASRLATGIRTPDPASFETIEALASAEITRILAAEQAATDKPAFIFCYHLFYRAPDLIGPALAKALGLPYIVAEASRAPKRGTGPFAPWHARAEQACEAAALIFCPSAHDRVMLEALKPPHQHLVDLKPFIDPADWPSPALVERSVGTDIDSFDKPAKLLSVAMMRGRYKLASYRSLALALAHVRHRSWQLDIVGDGPARAEVEQAFAPFGSRICYRGRLVDREALARVYSEADLFVWPAHGEALGMVFLEAALYGLPAITGAGRSVADVVINGETGLIVPDGDIPGLARAVEEMIDEPSRRRRLGVSARHFASEQRSIARARLIVGQALADLGIPLPRSGKADAELRG